MKRIPFFLIILILTAMSTPIADAAEPPDLVGKTFCDLYGEVYAGIIWGVFSPEYQAVFQAGADANGDSFLAPGPVVSFGGNGMPDCEYELKLVEAVLKDPAFSLPNGLTHALTVNAYNNNGTQFAADCNEYWDYCTVLAPGFQQVMKAMMVIGDGDVQYPEAGALNATGSVGYCAMFMFGFLDVNLDPGNYDRLDEYFGKDGDADGDGCTNYEEYLASGGDSAVYVAYALDPEEGCGLDAGFSTSTASGCAPLSVTFTDESIAPSGSPILTWSWDFDGDGLEDSNSPTPPLFVYNDIGDYTASLTVTNAEHTSTQTATIHVFSIEAAFTGANRNGCPPLTVDFSDASTDCGSPITDWAWDFEDDGIVDSHEPNPSHAYDTPGNYRVSLTVTNAEGSDTIAYDNFVEVNGFAADFTAGGTAGYAPLNVQFVDSSVGCTGAITGWEWDFDNDGIVDSYDQNPAHTYTTPGLYTVTLTARSATPYSHTQTKTNFISVGARLRVDQDNTSGIEDGSTWATAFTRIEDALAALGGAEGEIWVAEGLYDTTRTFHPSGALVLAPGTLLYGGFSGLGGLMETSVSQRDWTLHPTIIDGANGRGPAMPAYHVILGANESVLDGFIVRGGNANGSGEDDNGGGLLLSGGGVMTVAMIIANCQFLNNSAADEGGAIWFSENISTIYACTFTNNAAIDNGGALFATNDSSVIQECTFDDNTTLGYGGAVLIRGSGAPQIDDCSFTNNSAALGGGICCGDGTRPEITQCLFTGNIANQSGATLGGGGGLASVDAELYLDACRFTNNSSVLGSGAAGGGGGIAIVDGNNMSVISNSIFEGNSNEGGMMATGGAIGYGSMYGNPAFFTVGCTFYGNSDLSSPGGAVGALEVGGHITGFMANCILWGNTPGQTYLTPGFSLQNCDVEGGFPGNLDEDPLFADPAHGDYHLPYGSPCINAGDNAFGTFVAHDYEGTERPQMDTCDIGAYEFAAHVEAAFHITPAAGYAPFTMAPVNDSTSNVPVLNWAWDFGDTGNSMEENPEHTYTSPDTYICTLAMETAAGTFWAPSVMVRVGEPFVAGMGPQSLAVYAGHDVRFEVNPTGGLGQLHYQWMFDNGQKTPSEVGSDEPFLEYIAVTRDKAGLYWCEVNDDLGSVTYDAATLQIELPLIITKDPEGGERPAGQPCRLEIATTGGYQPLLFQWFKDSEPVSGATEAVYNIPALQFDQEGTYFCRVMDTVADYEADSGSAAIDVIVPVPVSSTGAILALSALVLAAVRRRLRK